MQAYKTIFCPIRVLVGSLIAIHGLLRIADISSYIEFVLDNFAGVLPFENLLIFGGALLPFLEFFTGMLIVFRIQLKRALWVGLFISVLMSTFILVGNMYERLIYHSIVVIGLGIVAIIMRLPQTKHWAR